MILSSDDTTCDTCVPIRGMRVNVRTLYTGVYMGLGPLLLARTRGRPAVRDYPTQVLDLPHAAVHHMHHILHVPVSMALSRSTCHTCGSPSCIYRTCGPQLHVCSRSMHQHMYQHMWAALPYLCTYGSTCSFPYWNSTAAALAGEATLRPQPDWSTVALYVAIRTQPLQGKHFQFVVGNRMYACAEASYTFLVYVSVVLLAT